MLSCRFFIKDARKSANHATSICSCSPCLLQCLHMLEPFLVTRQKEEDMETNQIQTLTGNFEGHAQQTENGVEYWLARDLQHLLGYTKWDNFLNVISKAKTVCELSGHVVSDHFADVGKMVDLGSGSQREIRGTNSLILNG